MKLRPLLGIMRREYIHVQPCTRPSDVTRDAVAHAREINADCVIAIGGGSTIGLGKAITLNTALPQIAVPTTYAGSEATPILGQTENGIKTTLTNAKVRPAAVLYDAELVTSLPIAMSVTSGLNAIAHAAEGLYAQEATEATRDLAIDGIRCFANGLPKVVQDRKMFRPVKIHCGAHGPVVRFWAQLGWRYITNYATPLAAALTCPMRKRMRSYCPTPSPLTKSLRRPNLRLSRRYLATRGLALHFGHLPKPSARPCDWPILDLLETDLERAAQIATEKPYWNPRDITKDAIRRILKQAWAGEPPERT